MTKALTALLGGGLIIGLAAASLLHGVEFPGPIGSAEPTGLWSALVRDLSILFRVAVFLCAASCLRRFLPDSGNN